MITDAEIKIRGIESLVSSLGIVEAGRFIALINRYPFDYTEWRHLLFEGMSLEEINEEATTNWKKEKQKETFS